jgi:hypothetical protein
VHWVAVPEALRARRVNRWEESQRQRAEQEQRRRRQQEEEEEEEEAARRRRHAQHKLEAEEAERVSASDGARRRQRGASQPPPPPPPPPLTDLANARWRGGARRRGMSVCLSQERQDRAAQERWESARQRERERQEVAATRIQAW